MASVDDPNRDELLAQQGALARFGELALRSEDLDEILHEACRLVGGALGTDLAKVVELTSDSQTLLVRAGVGWRPGVVGEIRIDISEPSPEGLVLRSREPVVSPDLRHEHRFRVPDFVLEHGVEAIVCVPIIGVDGAPPYGVLQVDSRKPQNFGDEHMSFLQTYANMLASAVGRLRAAGKLLKRAEENERLLREVQQRADDNERLLRELQHRVKNNLQVMVSLVEVQSRQAGSGSAKRALRAIGRRIEALRLLHDKLHIGGDVDRLDLSHYLSQLSAGLLQFHEDEAKRIKLVLDIERGLTASPDQAAPLGLVVNEFVTNSLKYAFDEGSGTIGLRIARLAGSDIVVELSDDGKGLPSEGVPSKGTGMRLIGNLARQLQSQPEWGANGGRGTQLRMELQLRRPVLRSDAICADGTVRLGL
jgi:two-component sensor histidine kinase